MADALGIPEDILQPYTAHSPEDLTVISTIGREFGVPEDIIYACQVALSKSLSDTRIWLSEENQIPGFRRIGMIGIDNGEMIVPVTTEDGLFGLYEVNDPGMHKQPMGEILRAVLEGERCSLSKTDPSRDKIYNINHFSRNHRLLVRQLFFARAAPVEAALKNRTNLDDRICGRFMSKLSGVLHDRAARNVGGIRKAIANSLDRDMFKLAWGNHQTDNLTLSWLSGADVNNFSRTPYVLTTEETKQRHLYRMQAASAYPFLLEDLSMFTRIIDEGAPLAETICTYMDIPSHVLSALNGKTSRMIGPSKARLSVLSHIEPDNFPNKIKEWRAFWSISVSDYFSRSQEIPTAKASSLTEDEIDLRKNFKQKLQDNLHHMSKDWEGSVQRYPEIISGNYRDMISSLYKGLAIPALLENDMISETDIINRYHYGAREFSYLLCSEYGLKQLENASRSWHRSIHNISDLLRVEDDTYWSSLLGNFESGDKITVRELTSSHDLKVQGIMENHCVGGYTSEILCAAALPDFSLIFSIEKEGQILSTVQVKCTQGNNDQYDFHISQNNAKSNTAPCREAIEVATQILEKLRALPPARLERYRRSMASTQNNMQTSKVSDLGVVCDYDVTSAGFKEKAWDTLSTHLPRKFRKLGPDEFGALIRQQITPSFVASSNQTKREDMDEWIDVENILTEDRSDDNDEETLLPF